MLFNRQHRQFSVFHCSSYHLLHSALEHLFDLCFVNSIFIGLPCGQVRIASSSILHTFYNQIEHLCHIKLFIRFECIFARNHIESTFLKICNMYNPKVHPQFQELNRGLPPSSAIIGVALTITLPEPKSSISKPNLPNTSMFETTVCASE